MTMTWARDQETTFFTYRELAQIPVHDCAAPMVRVDPVGGLRPLCLDPDMRPITGNDIYVRAPVFDLLQKAQDHVAACWRGASLEVVYGYRALSIQTKIFNSVYQTLCRANPTLPPEAIKDKAHVFIAVPEVAAHPTGGAVDVRVRDACGDLVPMGTDILTFEPQSYVHAPLDKQIWRNRQNLRAAMVQAGFAPFDGEWWHFSYGDREWAAYYRRPSAIFTQIAFRAPGL